MVDCPQDCLQRYALEAGIKRPFERRDLLNDSDLIAIKDSNSRRWLVLYSFYSADEPFED